LRGIQKTDMKLTWKTALVALAMSVVVGATIGLAYASLNKEFSLPIMATVTVKMVSAVETADVNKDGKVDGADLGIVTSNLNAAVPPGDARADVAPPLGVVDINDLAFVARYFGVAPPQPPPPNLPPTANAGPDQTVNEGVVVNLNGAASSDPEGGALTFLWSQTAGPSVTLAGATTATPSFQAVDGPSTFTFQLIVNDGVNSSTPDTVTVTVNNVAPIVTATGDQTVKVGTLLTLSPIATFTDPGTADTHTATIDWDDGTVETGDVTQGAGTGDVSGSHTYLSTGDFVVTLTMTDDDGGVGTGDLKVMVTPSPPPAPLTINLGPVRDNTLYENLLGSLSNGKGAYLFAGKTNGGSIRRGVIAFDIAGNISSGAKINNVRLTMNMSRTSAGAQTIGLHRLLADWGEGTSDAAGNEGIGTNATLGDATWLHRFFDATRWQTPGGDFSPTVSASTSAGGTGKYTWNSTPQMIADVQAWLDNPSSNFGWLLKGTEAGNQTAKRFDSRENSVVENRPVLTIVFTPSGP